MWGKCAKACLLFTNNRALERTLQRSSPASVFSYLFPAFRSPDSRNLNPSPSSSLSQLLPLAVAWHLALWSCHICSFRRGPIASCSDATAPVSTHLTARTGTLLRRNMPHGQRISAAAGEKYRISTFFPPSLPASLSLSLSLSPLVAFTLDPV